MNEVDKALDDLYVMLRKLYRIQAEDYIIKCKNADLRLLLSYIAWRDFVKVEDTPGESE